MRKIFAFLLLFVAVLLFAKLAFAQTASSSAVQLTFPITELGNCSSAADCKTYCDDPTHLDACIAYAKEKGFYKESSLDSDQTAILADAKATLGCDSVQSCRIYCQQADNADACSAFAQKHNLRGGQQNISSSVLQKAQQSLGCSSEDSCKTFCEQDANKQKCADFAKQQGLRGGDETVGPGGCTSESACKAYCSDPTHFQACSLFVESKEGTGSGKKKFTGPGGCTSESSCQSFCSQNPTACHMNPAGHESAMSATAAAKLENLQDCREHPEKCQRTGSGSANTKTPPNRDEGNTQQFHQEGQRGGGQQLPPQINQQSGETNQQTSGSGGGGSEGSRGGSGSGSGGESESGNVFPTATQSVQAATTHRDFFSWFIATFLHLQ